jgi:hypothetical protein
MTPWLDNPGARKKEGRGEDAYSQEVLPNVQRDRRRECPHNTLRHGALRAVREEPANVAPVQQERKARVGGGQGEAEAREGGGRMRAIGGGTTERLSLYLESRSFM